MEHVFFMGIVFGLLGVAAYYAALEVASLVFIGLSVFMLLSFIVVGRHDIF